MPQRDRETKRIGSKNQKRQKQSPAQQMVNKVNVYQKLAAKEKNFRPAALEQTQIYNVVLLLVALTRLMQVLYMAIVRK